MIFVVLDDMEHVYESLALYGIGYAPTTDLLFILPSARGNREVLGSFEPMLTPSPSIGLLLDQRYAEEIGFVCIYPVHLMLRFDRNILPRPCPMSFFLDLADDLFFQCEEGKRSLDDEEQELAENAHAFARELTRKHGPIHKQVLEEIENRSHEVRFEYARKQAFALAPN